MLYNKDTVTVADGRAIALRYIEEISYESDTYEDVVNELKDDLCMHVVMTSGRSHVISMNVIKKFHGYSTIPHNVLRAAIFDRWAFILKGDM